VAAGFELATVGDNCIDRYLAPVGASTVGGNAVNVAVHLAARGHRVAYAGAVGADADGRRVVAALEQAGVGTGLVRVVSGGRTATSDIRTGGDGERAIGPEDFGVCLGYRPDADTLAVLLGCRHVHIGWLDDGGDLRRRLVGDGVAVSQDLAVNAAARDLGAEGLAPAFASAATLDDGVALARRLLAAGARLVVVTCGRSGSLASDGTTVARVGVAPARVVDTLGAGDTVIAAFIAGRARGLGLQACLEAGRDDAALTCGHLGGFPQTPLAPAYVRTAASCSGVSMAPGRAARTRAMASAAVMPWATRATAAMVPVRPRPAAQCTNRRSPSRRRSTMIATKRFICSTVGAVRSGIGISDQARPSLSARARL